MHVEVSLGNIFNPKLPLKSVPTVSVCEWDDEQSSTIHVCDRSLLNVGRQLYHRETVTAKEPKDILRCV